MHSAGPGVGTQVTDNSVSPPYSHPFYLLFIIFILLKYQSVKIIFPYSPTTFYNFHKYCSRGDLPPSCRIDPSIIQIPQERFLIENNYFNLNYREAFKENHQSRKNNSLPLSFTWLSIKEKLFPFSSLTEWFLRFLTETRMGRCHWRS